MRLSVFTPQSSQQLFIDLQKLYKGYLSDSQLTTQGLQDLIETPDKLFFITLFNARHLGAVQVTIDKHTATLSLLCIRDITRRRGVGKNLLREVEKQLANDGVKEVQLLLSEISTPEQQGMQLFMQSCGYQLDAQLLVKSL
ncbi:aspartate 1-decarboxylase autocleavage activator PanM [Psychromonas sp. psych-6C06]|uniref:aspartate 1-decarboxylase autocleavage activator PanM n=1 Tax=Psychromonas sp. psych-6C06 TaxID=2058089 RepID=UPI000C32BF67|nr:aspartate 1-decarboxylase autocleavage activator PanM [Psychromonas sp. psych-6C06]PKF60289.1 aspartate 1-decarboxylase autocleavage activator PanM [Psychromonas sp. psych-6C06]